MKRRAQSFCVMILAAVLAFSAGMLRAQTAQAPDCIVAAYYPPFMNSDSDTNAGMSIDIIREAARRAGREVQIQFLPFPRLLMELQSPRDCIMPALFRNLTREGQYQWIATYDSADLRVLTMGAPVNTIEDARALPIIGVEAGASADQFLTSLGFENLYRVPGPASSAKMLYSGRVSAWVQTSTVAKGMWQELGLKQPVQMGAPIYSVPVYVAARLGFPDAVAQTYHDAIHEMIADGTVERIMASYK